MGYANWSLIDFNRFQTIGDAKPTFWHSTTGGPHPCLLPEGEGVIRGPILNPNFPQPFWLR